MERYVIIYFAVWNWSIKTALICFYKQFIAIYKQPRP